MPPNFEEMFKNKNVHVFKFELRSFKIIGYAVIAFCVAYYYMRPNPKQETRYTTVSSVATPLALRRQVTGLGNTGAQSERALLFTWEEFDRILAHGEVHFLSLFLIDLLVRSFCLDGSSLLSYSFLLSCAHMFLLLKHTLSLTLL